MLIEFLNVVSVDKKPFAENFRLNIQPANHQLRLKVTYINGEDKIPVDLVVFNWSPKIEKFTLGISIDGKEMTTGMNFLVRLSYDVLKRHIKLTGNVAGKDIKFNITSVKDFLEIPKEITFPTFPKFQKGI